MSDEFRPGARSLGGFDLGGWIYPYPDDASGETIVTDTFAEGTRPAALKLVSSRASENGITINISEPAGEPQYGNMAE
jgi:hypothetical protein